MATDLKSFDELVNLILKEFGDNAIFNPKKHQPISKVERISTGNLQLDMDLGGGLTRGRTHLITGPFSSGKTFLSLKIASEFTKNKERVAIVEPEFTFDPVWAEYCGVDGDLLWVARKDNQEDNIDLIELLVASGEFGLIILDSMAAQIPKKVKENDASKSSMGVEAKLNNQMFRKITSQQVNKAQEGKVAPTVLVINQWRKKLGVMFGSPNTLPGGEGQYYMCSTWIDFWADETILNKDERVVGMYFGYNIRKNKTAPPRRTGRVSMFLDMYNGMKKGDWDHLGAVMDVAVSTGVIAKEGKWYKSPLLPKQFMYSQLWKELYVNSALEGKILAGVKTATPDVEFSYSSPPRLLKKLDAKDAKEDKDGAA